MSYNINIVNKGEQMDIYNLINSKAISEHCRKIKHQFNTEELAVLIYRNKRMNIDKKISAYEELIEDYPDMEVIKRSNCRHYDSVKVMIKEEIKRIKELKEKLEKEEQDVIYTYNYWCNCVDNIITTGKDEYRDIYKTFKEVQKEIENKIKEDEEQEIISFLIRKREFSKDSRYNIGAEYILNKDRKLEMVNIYDYKSEWLDINGICLNIPTPFKKGDLLISTSQTPFGGECILNYDKFPFVLDYLINWDEKFKENLGRGCYDSSDMQGPGYIINDNNELVCDNVFDYDNWEYFEGELEGIDRLLKSVSSLLKGEIDITLFISAYEKIIQEYHSSFYWFTDEGLKLCGFSDKDILNIRGK